MATQTEHGATKRNDRLLGVAIDSYDHMRCETITDLPSNLLSQVEEFFVAYNKQRKKKFQIKDVGRPKKAMKFLKEGMQSFKKAQEDSK